MLISLSIESSLIYIQTKVANVDSAFKSMQKVIREI